MTSTNTGPATADGPLPTGVAPGSTLGGETARIPAQGGHRAAPPAKPRRRAWLVSPATVAIVTFVVGTPVAYVASHLGGSTTGGGQRTWSLPVAAALIGAVVLGLVALRRLPGWVAGAAAGVSGAWAVLAMSTIYRGTPFPPSGLIADAGRLAALATRYSVTPVSSDAWVPGYPGEYPPLFPWVVGRISALTGVEAWKLVGRAEFIVTGAGIVVGFLLWRRLVPEWTALLASLALFAVLASPPKSYEFIAAMALLPWLLSTVVKPPRGRMHWLPAGLIGGLIFLSYYGWFIFGVFGLIAIVISVWRSEPQRRAYGLYLLKIFAVAFVIASWYLIPFVKASIAGTDSLGDLNGAGGSFDDMFPFLNFTVAGVLELIGLVGLLLLARTVWWAKPLLTLAIGAFVYRVVTITGLVLTNHSQLSQYAPRLYVAVLTVAGVLVLAHAVPRLIARFDWSAPRNLIAVGLAVAIGFIGLNFTTGWMPTGAYGGTYTVRAYGEPYPDGRYLVADKAAQTPWFPVTPVQQAVEQVYGPNVRRVSLSVDDRLYAYLPWPGYLTTDRIGLFIKWDERYAEVQRLAATHDPDEFAKASANTRFGPIDIFILHSEGGSWSWSAALGYNAGTGTVNFSPSQFDPSHWVVRDDLPEHIVVAIRR